MSKKQNKFDFEKNWQAKLAGAVEERTDPNTRMVVLEGGESLNQESPTEEKIRWTCLALSRLGEHVGLEERQEILAECACQYPREDLKEIKMTYRIYGDVDQAINMLQEKFEGFLREDLGLEETLFSDIIDRGWGLAGVRDGNRIIATKIPKSGTIREYFNEEDSEKKRRCYCHCPRVREGVGKEPHLPEEYCYCGAGFYQGIWEEILGEPVRVELLESVMCGDEVCKVAIYLPK